MIEVNSSVKYQNLIFTEKPRKIHGLYENIVVIIFRKNCRVTKFLKKYLLPRALLFEKYIKKKIEKPQK